MNSPDSQLEGIAIVGMAGRFPGARNIAEFWRNLVAGTESIAQLTDEQLAAAGLDAAVLRAQPDYVAARGVIERPEWFDAAFFGPRHLAFEFEVLQVLSLLLRRAFQL